MSTARVSGYGVKVTSQDAGMDVKKLASLFAENDKDEFLDSFFTEYPEITDFSFLAFSFLELIDHNSEYDFEFIFVDDREENSFAIIASRTAAKVKSDFTPVKPGTAVDIYDKLTMDNFLSDFLPGYKADWICEEISPEWVNIVNFADETADI